MKLSILHKGLIIISIPLLFELFFISVLLYLLNEASILIKSEMRSQDKLVNVETIIKELADSTTSAILFNVSRDEKLLARNRQSRANLSRAHGKLRKLVDEDKEETTALNRLYSSANSWMQHQDFAISSDPRERLSAFFFLPQSAEAERLMVMRPEGPARVIIEKETRLRENDSKLRKENVIRIYLLLLFGLAVSFAITFILSLYFAKYIVQRLDNVLANTYRLGARLPLQPPLRGDDEIAELDAAVHSAASEILEFEKFKEQIIAVVSHELRTPLTSVQGALTLAEAGALGDFTPRGREEIDKARTSLTDVIKLVNNLLLLERIEAGTQKFKSNALDLSEIVDRALIGQAEFVENKRLEVVCDLSPLALMCDEERIEQAIAIFLRVSLERAPVASKLEITLFPERERACLNIADRGVSLSSTQKKDFFERGSSFTAMGTGGSVLDLALAKAIILAQGGNVAIEDDNSSTRITVCIPLSRSLPMKSD